ncbi:hypothetical protein [Corallococcus silvisoli]|uniref:hypothetical protein n=1 Tax=Corallococcus silvisoli TaxID=2697031 RepID=UPI0013783150|nr:hypothetical protein [Corallococcus silvisoli]NBD08802.1 hypothetical protein [Corallococcus silvisoli]
MRVRSGCALVWLGLAGCGALPDEGVETREVTAQACPAGVASRVKVVVPPGSGASVNGPYPESLVDVQGALYFATNLFDGSAVLWRSNGTEAGTVQVKSFPPASVGVPRMTSLVPVGKKVFFQFDDPGTGQELWISDGTGAGTHLVKDVTPGPQGTRFAFTAAQNGRLTFIREWAFAPGNPQVEVWRSDGTAAGTVQVVNFGTLGKLVSPSMLGSTLLFFLETPGTGTSLWRTDGTAAGTLHLGNFGPLATPPYTSFEVGNARLFFVNTPGQGTHLWRTDGTPAGTSWVKKLDADAVLIPQTGFAGNLGLFLLSDGPNTEVWKTDGTPGGTVRLETFGKFVQLLGALNTSVYLYSVDSNTKRLRIESVSLAGGGKASVTTLPNPYADQEGAYPSVQRTATSGGKLYFSVAIGTSGPAPREVSLWASNGTGAGTVQLSHTLSTSDEYASPLFPTGTGPVLFVASKSGSGIEPWFTQGSAATTGQLAEIRPGAGSSNPDGFTRIGNRIYFRAADDTNSFQLWSMPASFSCPAGLAEAK